MKLTQDQLQAYRGATLPDLLGEKTRLLFVGINPGLRTAAVQAHFARRGNRFYPALYAAGITDRPIDAHDGYRPEDLAHLKERGIGITNVVRVATARAEELTPAELLEGGRDLERRVRRIGPEVVAVLGVTAYRAAFGQPKAAVGRQTDTLGGARLWIAPNPSGLNAHSQLADLAASYRAIAADAGLHLFPPPTS
ncbi:MAG: mismatch-specific DNA-glycosylase [Sporichthyaceae bacterium]